MLFHIKAVASVLQRKVSVSQIRQFGRSLEDVPATLRHYWPGKTIDMNVLQLSEITRATSEMSTWVEMLNEMRVEYDRRMKTMQEGMALQGTMQAIIMIDGLLEHAHIVQKSLRVLHNHKLPTKQRNMVNNTSELSTALSSLKPYYDGSKFIFDFDPPFYLMSQS